MEWLIIRILGTKEIISSRGILVKGRTPSVFKGKLEVVMEYRVALSTRKCVAKTLSAPLLNPE